MLKRSRSARGVAAAALLSFALTGLPNSANSTEPASAGAFSPQLVTVQTPTRADKDRLETLGLDLTEHAGAGFVEVLLHTTDDVDTLRASGLAYDVRIADMTRREAEINQINAEFAASTSVSRLPSGRTSYRTLADYETDMSKLAKRHPKIVRKITLKRPSLNGVKIHGVEIGAHVRRAADGRPTFLLLGVHHAREWPSGELAMEFGVDLVKHYGSSARITRLLHKARVIVVPVVNVDGFDLSRTDGELVDLRALNDVDPTGGTASVAATPGQAYKRKNCRVVDGEDTPDGSCRGTASSPLGEGIGVDLNRNYGGFWGGPGAAGPEPDPGSTSTGTMDPTYRGASAFSEPETQNIHDLIASRQVTMMISLHTYSNLVLRPNGVNPLTIGPDGKPVGDPPDEAGMKALGARFAAQNGYDNTHGWQLYDTTGTTEDWSYNNTGGYGYTFEVGPNEFHPPFPEVIDEYLGAKKYAGKGNRAAFLIALEHAADQRASGVLKGRAPKGAVLTLSKKFRTPTWQGSFADRISSRLAVGRDGAFRWVVNPSTRPVVRSHPYQVVSDKAFQKVSFDGTVAPNSHNDHEFTLSRRAANMHVELDWPTPDDLDLEVYRKTANGLVKVGSSGSAPGSKESTDIADQPAGTYVLRVINFASASPTYTVSAAMHTAVTRHTVGKREAYTFTCAVDGKVRQTGQVYVDRGQVRRLDLGACFRG